MKGLLGFIIVIFGGSFDQEDSVSQFRNDFNQVADAFESNAKPYINEFTSRQIEPLANDASKELETIHKLLIETNSMIHMARLEEFRKRSFASLLERMPESYNSERDMKKIIQFFELAYKNEFLYLDYKFFQKVKEDLKKKG